MAVVRAPHPRLRLPHLSTRTHTHSPRNVRRLSFRKHTREAQAGGQHRDTCDATHTQRDTYSETRTASYPRVGGRSTQPHGLVTKTSAGRSCTAGAEHNSVSFIAAHLVHKAGAVGEVGQLAPQRHERPAPRLWVEQGHTGPAAHHKHMPCSKYTRGATADQTRYGALSGTHTGPQCTTQQQG